MFIMIITYAEHEILINKRSRSYYLLLIVQDQFRTIWKIHWATLVYLISKLENTTTSKKFIARNYSTSNKINADRCWDI